ncbi:MAG: hypothetical protein IJQ11_00080 [Bacteroidales bacterium]|nr:hypothetical protein [Bacteroidales bacterium]
MKATNQKVYEAPKAEIIEIETQGVFCASSAGGSRGGTESMNMTNVNWP